MYIFLFLRNYLVLTYTLYVLQLVCYNKACQHLQPSACIHRYKLYQCLQHTKYCCHYSLFCLSTFSYFLHIVALSSINHCYISRDASISCKSKLSIAYKLFFDQHCRLWYLMICREFIEIFIHH